MHVGHLLYETNGIYLVKMSERRHQYYLASVDLNDADNLLIREITLIPWSVDFGTKAAEEEINKKCWVPQQYIGEVQ